MKKILNESLRALVTALRTLTIVTVPGSDTETFSSSFFWFPLVGLLLGIVQVLPAYAFHFVHWDELGALVALIAGIVLTRGMHADGLADVADGFWGGRTKEAALRIMKDSAVGSFGVLALSLLLLLKWVALLRLLESGSFYCIVSGVVLGRWVQVMLASLMPYARSGGGTAQSFVQGAGAVHAIVASLLTLCLLAFLLYANLSMFLVVVFAAVASGSMVARLSYRKIGGVTGDVLGAGSEITEAVVWIAAGLYPAVQSQLSTCTIFLSGKITAVSLPISGLSL